MKIEHNKKVFWIIIILLVILVLLLVYIRQNSNKELETEKECNLDEDCIPATCCHPDSCIAKEKAPECEEIFCTMNCEPETLDCGQGECKCKENKCIVKFN